MFALALEYESPCVDTTSCAETVNVANSENKHECVSFHISTCLDGKNKTKNPNFLCGVCVKKGRKMVITLAKNHTGSWLRL